MAKTFVDQINEFQQETHARRKKATRILTYIVALTLLVLAAAIILPWAYNFPWAVRLIIFLFTCVLIRWFLKKMIKLTWEGFASQYREIEKETVRLLTEMNETTRLLGLAKEFEESEYVKNTSVYVLADSLKYVEQFNAFHSRGHLREKDLPKTEAYNLSKAKFDFLKRLPEWSFFKWHWEWFWEWLWPTVIIIVGVIAIVAIWWFIHPLWLRIVLSVVAVIADIITLAMRWMFKNNPL
jgi:ABC-type multidrug transport system fused ATPase/permease subunit